MMSPFPCPVERNVASGLLLLSSKPFFLSQPKLEQGEIESKGYNNERLSLLSSRSRSCVSALSSDSSSQETGDHRLRSDFVAPRYRMMNLKMVRKRRSKVCWSSDNLKLPDVKPVADLSSGSNESKAESCLSSGSSAASSVRRELKSRFLQRDEVMHKQLKKKYGSKSNSISRRAEAILEFLSDSSCSSEVKIRKMLGDSPDTSKALRMLLKMEEIKRSGTGGRQDPYIYTVLIPILLFIFLFLFNTFVRM